MLWHIALKFCIWLCLTVLQIKFEWNQFASIFVGVMPLLELRILKYTVFRTFLLHVLMNWAEILHTTSFYCTTGQIRINLRQLLWELCPFWNLKYWKYTFPAFFSYMLWHIELEFCITGMSLFYCTSYQVWVSSICVNFCRSYASFGP